MCLILILILKLMNKQYQQLVNGLVQVSQKNRSVHPNFQQKRRTIY